MCEISPTFYEKNKGGVIVNIGSIGGHAYLDCLVPYCASLGEKKLNRNGPKI
jgi:short-subunit dehydrogenase